MYWTDHAPPHIHVFYGEYEAQFDINGAGRIEGKLPKRIQLLVVEWILQNQDGLKELWELAIRDQPLYKLPPLE
jgi:Domain of unknown function (DUF4160)